MAPHCAAADVPQHGAPYAPAQLRAARASRCRLPPRAAQARRCVNVTCLRAELAHALPQRDAAHRRASTACAPPRAANERAMLRLRNVHAASCAAPRAILSAAALLFTRRYAARYARARATPSMRRRVAVTAYTGGSMQEAALRRRGASSNAICASIFMKCRCARRYATMSGVVRRARRGSSARQR